MVLNPVTTRFAPTPSGFLHPGNAVNLLLASWWARSTGGRLLLRIDDMDATRLRPEYLDDIFRVLQWLAIVPDGGPGGPEEFARDWSMEHRREQFRGAAAALLASGEAYACRCSRRDLGAVPPVGGCPAGCRWADLPWEPGATALRLAVDVDAVVPVDGRPWPVAAGLGDVVLWRRDDLPAYQLASVLMDCELGIDAVVRGEDLRGSTAVQRYLAPLVPAPGFAAADVRHHPMLTGPDGVKLSKSTGAQAVSMAGDAALRQVVLRQARELAPTVGVEPVG
jgi:glutamyl-tRNA synthetase